MEMIKDIFSCLRGIVVNAALCVKLTIEKNLYSLGEILEIAIPYIMFMLIGDLVEVRGKFAIGGEIFLPVILLITSRIMKEIANKKGKGKEVPIARKRFTEENENGIIEIKESDIQEIIIYLADVENYIERRGQSERWE